MGGDFFLHRDCRFVEIGFYLHRVRRPPARSGDGKNLDGCDSARVFGTQRSRIRGDWVVSIQRLPMHWSLRDSLGDDIAFFHPRCKQNFVVVFVSFFLELESIETRKVKIVKNLKISKNHEKSSWSEGVTRVPPPPLQSRGGGGKGTPLPPNPVVVVGHPPI